MRSILNLVLVFALAWNCEASIPQLLHPFQFFTNWAHAFHIGGPTKAKNSPNSDPQIDQKPTIEFFEPLQNGRPVNANGGNSLEFRKVVIQGKPVLLVETQPTENAISKPTPPTVIPISVPKSSEESTTESSQTTSSPAVDTKDKHLEDLEIPGGDDIQNDLPDKPAFEPKKTTITTNGQTSAEIELKTVTPSSSEGPSSSTAARTVVPTTTTARTTVRTVTLATTLPSTTSRSPPITEEVPRNSQTADHPSKPLKRIPLHSQVAVNPNDLFQALDDFQ